jgi:hypothetical protein
MTAPKPTPLDGGADNLLADLGLSFPIFSLSCGRSGSDRIWRPVARARDRAAGAPA